MKRPLLCVTKAVGIALVLTLAVSCIGIETKITFKEDGSGSASFKYKISQMIMNLGSTEEGEDPIPLPVSDEDFRAAVESADGVEISGNVTQTEDEENIYIEASVLFDKVESLSAMEDFESMPATLERDGDRWVFRQVIVPGEIGDAEEEIDAESMGMIEAMFSGYEIAFTVVAPRNIQSASMGEVTGKSVRYAIAMPDLLKQREETVLEVVW